MRELDLLEERDSSEERDLWGRDLQGRRVTHGVSTTQKKSRFSVYQ